MLVRQRSLACADRQASAPFIDAKLKNNEFMALGISLNTACEVRSVPMQPKQMRGVHGIFHRLQPVTIDGRFLDDPASTVFPNKHIPTRQQRPRLRAEVSENQSAEWLYRISDVFDSFFERAARRFCGLFQALAGVIKFPTMIRTSDTFVIDSPVGQGSQAMRAMFADQSIFALLIAVDNEFFAQNLDRPDGRLFGELPLGGNRVPV